MGIVTFVVAALHALASFINFRLGFLLFVFFYGTYPRLFAIGAGEEGFALTAQRLMLLTLAFLFGLRVLYGSADIVRMRRVISENRTAIALFCGLLLARLLGSIFTGNLDVAAIATFADGVVTVLLLVIFVITTVQTDRDIKTLLLVLAISLIPNQLVAIVEYVQQKSIFPESLSLEFETSLDQETLLEGAERYGEYRVMGTFDSSLKLMEMSILMLPILVYLFQTVKRPSVKYLVLAILIMEPIVIFWTGSRTGLMLLVLIIAYYGYQFVLKKFGRNEALLLLIAAGVCSGVVLFFAFDSLINGFFFGSEGGKSSASRFLQYLITWPLILESPWLGYGFARNIVDIIDIETGIDGYYLRTVLEGGIVALACLLGLYFISLRTLSKLRNAKMSEDLVQLSTALYLTFGLAAIMMLALNMGTSVTFVFIFMGLTMVIRSNSCAKPAPGGSSFRVPVASQYFQRST